MVNNLSKWSWADIQAVYATFAHQYKEIERLTKACGIEKLEMNIDYPELKNIFIIRALRSIKQIDKHVAILDKEIDRRNKLIGVMG